MGVSDEVVANHQAPAVASKKSAAALAGTSRNHDTMNAHLVGRRQVDRKWVLACWIEEDPLGMLANPALGAIDLAC